MAPPGALRKIDKEGRRFTPIFRPVTFLVAIGVVLVAPRSGSCAIVYVIIIMAGMAVV